MLTNQQVIMDARYETFTILINKISRYILKIKSFEMESLGLKSTHVSCLYFLYRQNKSLTAHELTVLCDEDKGAISRSIDYLKDNGYIEYEKDVSKPYKTPMYLTDKGKKVGEIINEKINNIVDVASFGLNDEEKDIMYHCLNTICNNLMSHHKENKEK